jgi:hypothetical protein
MLNVFIFSCDKNECSQFVEVSKANFQLDSHSLGVDYWTCFGDPIYDIDGDNSREVNVDYVPLRQPCLVGVCTISLTTLPVAFAIPSTLVCSSCKEFWILGQLQALNQ